MAQEQKSFPLINDPAPEFKAQTTFGEINFPSDYKGKWIVLFSHPADFTPVCTTEFVMFQSMKDQFDELNAQLIGLSIDQAFSHIKWVEWIKENMEVEIQFPIIADHGKIAELYGMVHPGQGSSTVRAVFIIDPNGKIRTILYYPQELGRNMDEIVRIIKAMQISDEHKVAMPAHWPNNPIFGSKVIIPPAKDYKTAMERLEKAKAGEFECKDWWLCYRDL